MIFRIAFQTTIIIAFISLSFTGCSMVGPDYERPDVRVPEAFPDAVTAVDATLPKTEWWSGFNDPVLDRLIKQAEDNSPTLDAALERVERAAARAQVAGSELFPDIDYFSEAVRRRRSGNTGFVNQGDRTQNEYQLALDLEWEIDLWGRLRRLERSGMATAEAAARAYASAVLLIRTGVAEAYFRVRYLDRSIRILEQTVENRLDTLRLAEVRNRSGLGDQLEEAQARTEWATASAGLQNLRRNRALAENALGLLIGVFASEFELLPDPAWKVAVPDLPAVIPSELLKRRPDISEAERLLAAASERIGAAQANYYPAIELSGGVGVDASSNAELFSKSSVFGFLGPDLNLPVFTGGRIQGQVNETRAAFAELLALYMEQVLEAFRQVDDALAQLRYLDAEIEAEVIATESSQLAARLARQRFDSGLVNFLEVIDTERLSLSTALRLNELQSERLTQHIALLRSLGGGWQETNFSLLDFDSR